MLKKYLVICLIAYISTITPLHGKEFATPVFHEISTQSKIDFQHLNGAFGKKYMPFLNVIPVVIQSMPLS
jgi:hypothetical protein